MDAIQRGIITLIKSAVLQQGLELPEGFDLEQALPQIRRHSIIALCYDGAVRCGIDQKLPVMQKLFMGYVRAMQISEGQLRQIRRICDAFETNGIDYMLLKGANMKHLYPAPELRTMGDVDILIRMEQYDRIEPVMQELGYTFEKEVDCEIVWDHKELHLELHKRMLSRDHKDYYLYLGEGWNRAISGRGNSFFMKPEDVYIFEIIHFAKHFRNGGIGLRHVTDLWLYRDKYPDLDEGYLLEELRKLNMEEFYGNIRRLIGVWFLDQPEDEMTEFLSAYIFASGNWGLAEEHFLSSLLRKEQTEPGQTSQAGFIVSKLFPSAEHLAPKYTVLQKAPWLLPAVWVYRPFYKLFRERDSLKREVAKVELVTEEKLDAKRQMLRSVGLEFNF